MYVMLPQKTLLGEEIMLRKFVPCGDQVDGL